MKKGDKVKVQNYTGMGSNRYVVLETPKEEDTLIILGREKSGGLLGHLDSEHYEKERVIKINKNKDMKTGR